MAALEVRNGLRAHLLFDSRLRLDVLEQDFRSPEEFSTRGGLQNQVELQRGSSERGKWEGSKLSGEGSWNSDESRGFQGKWMKGAMIGGTWIYSPLNAITVFSLVL